MAMGDGILTLAVQKLTDFIITEATFLSKVKHEVVSIRDELIWMQSFLKDAEQKQGTDERIRQWIAEIRSVAFKTEDIIDDFYTEVKGKEPSKIKLLTISLQKCFCIGGETKVYDIGKEIKALKQRLSDISRKREVYGINNIGNDVQEIANAGSQNQLLRDLRRTTSFTDDEDFVGFDDDVKLLEEQLLLSTRRRGVVSILGMGGLGKTSLARKLYNTNKDRFHLHAWVCVSQEWNTKDLLARIIKSLKNPTYEELKMLEKMNDDDMKRHLHELLKDKRFLVVIDDIWNENAWECLRSALPDNQNGSRVIITTRNESVAELSDERTFIHKLRRLREDESWELFCKKAFPNRNSACPGDLEKIGKEMVAKCDGLPLAVIVLGGLLSRKQSNNEWRVIRKRIWKALIDKSVHISTLLELSYNDLSRELKSCFLYLGFFPEDYEIHSEKLIQLWIAEDLIPQSEGWDLEELAESYIKELHARSLIQLNRNHLLHCECRVHDLLRDLGVNKAKELEFFHTYDESVSPSINPFSTRRIAFRSGFERYMAIDHSRTRLHTLSFLNYHNRCLDDGDVTKFLTLINTRFKSLRVLDLEGVEIETTESKLKLLEAMGKFVHLRYLVLFKSNTSYELPAGIGNLQALQVLEWKGNVMLLPRDMYKLKQLRHLSGRFITKEGDIIVPTTSFEDLTNLHYLNQIDIDGWLRNEESDEFALKAFSKLHSMKTLSVRFYNTNYRLSIEPLFSCKNLIDLKLVGRIKSLPMDLHESLPNLKFLTLRSAYFVQDPIPALEKLPNLFFLALDGFEIKSLIITARGFYKLVSLIIRNIPSDMNLQIEEGALPSLKRKEIKALKERLSDISRKREVYDINNIGSTQEIANAKSQDQLLWDLRKTTSLTDEKHFVGLDDDVKLLETQLFLFELSCRVVSIWEMGGSGKTSLARKLYNTNKDRFELHAWVCVSQEWNTKDLLARIITSLRTPTYEELKMFEKMADDNMKRSNTSAREVAESILSRLGWF